MLFQIQEIDFPQELVLCGTDSHVDDSPNATILIFSCHGQNVIHHTYPHNPYFLTSQIYFISPLTSSYPFNSNSFA